MSAASRAHAARAFYVTSRLVREGGKLLRGPARTYGGLRSYMEACEVAEALEAQAKFSQDREYSYGVLHKRLVS